MGRMPARPGSLAPPHRAKEGGGARDGPLAGENVARGGVGARGVGGQAQQDREHIHVRRRGGLVKPVVVACL
jgi:hypothetical protein